MYLIHPKKENPEVWEVAWMWLPQFMAMDKEIHRALDKKLTEEFSGQDYTEENRSEFQERINKTVVAFLQEKFPIPGMRRFLDGYIHLKEEE